MMIIDDQDNGHKTSPELRRKMDSWYRKLRAKKLGYHPDDEFFYSEAMIERLLPYAIDPNAIPPPTIRESVNRNHAGKAEGYGGWEASMADLRRALDRGLTKIPAIQQFLGGEDPHREAKSA